MGPDEIGFFFAIHYLLEFIARGLRIGNSNHREHTILLSREREN